MQSLKFPKGQIYILGIELNKDIKIAIGKLGNISFSEGFYLYIGSAKNRLYSRLRRHLSLDKRLFWHIDYLLTSSATCIKKIWINSNKSECSVVRLINGNLKSQIIRGFGSSDCRCPGHLVFMPHLKKDTGFTDIDISLAKILKSKVLRKSGSIVQVKILFDKEALNRNLYTGWGVSFLIDDRILFDTGENGEWLINNMQQLGGKVDKLQAIIISHDHWDHTGGLWEILKKRRLRVYGCPNFSEGFKRRIRDLNSEFISVDKVTKISDSVYLTGEIPGYYVGANIAEQAVIIKTATGISVLTGCSHPGIIKILKKIKSEFPKEKFYLVAGGFHLVEQEERLVKIIVEEFKKLQVRMIGPTHCTGYEATDIFKNKYKNDFISVKVGQTLKL